MDPLPISKTTNTLLWLDDNKIIFASKRGCYVKSPFSSIAKFMLHGELTHHIIANKNNTKVGLFCPNSFVVYDLSTRKKIWSLRIPYSDNYSATFNPSDDIIMCHKKEILLNHKQILNLPLSESDALFDIGCNQKTKELIYPSSNNTFSIQSLESNKIVRHPREFIYDNRNYQIISAFYTCHNGYILVHAYKKSETEKLPTKEFFLLHHESRTIINIPFPQNKIKCSYHDVKILPHSWIAAALCSNRYMHFFDIIQKEEILVDALDNSRSYACKNDTNIFDFDAHAAYYAVITQKKSYLRKTPECLLRYICKQNTFLRNSYVPYALLSHYFQEIGLFVPKDIKFLLMHYLHRVYTQEPKNTLK